ncbi:MAG: DNA methyltransferase [Candidatus Parabeggiatoa sp. nov. 2]|nr:MAG: DNA methyltransferase [Gammaproteobacteria bacterium]
MAEPKEVLGIAFREASANLEQSFVADEEIRNKIEYVSSNIKNRAGVRLLMACLLAKIHQPEVDIRKPYTKIEESDAFSGRTYDERYITSFINEHNLPCNNTTAFFSPALRNLNVTLTKNINLVGRPPQLYQFVLELLDDVYTDKIQAKEMLFEIVRCLVIIKNERQQRIDSLIKGLKTTKDSIPLSSEDIVILLEQHMKLTGTCRLPVLIIAAAYKAAEKNLGEKILPLHSHNTADTQTGVLGDVEITLLNDEKTITCYEMKEKCVNNKDIDRALQKLSSLNKDVDNYIFITTDKIEETTQEYARSLYNTTGGIEFVIVDCIGFLRHFLHLFHRIRSDFLEIYQTQILEESDNSISQPVKEAFLAMRQAAEASIEND